LIQISSFGSSQVVKRFLSAHLFRGVRFLTGLNDFVGIWRIVKLLIKGKLPAPESGELSGNALGMGDPGSQASAVGLGLLLDRFLNDFCWDLGNCQVCCNNFNFFDGFCYQRCGGVGQDG